MIIKPLFLNICIHKIVVYGGDTSLKTYTNWGDDRILDVPRHKLMALIYDRSSKDR